MLLWSLPEEREGQPKEERREGRRGWRKRGGVAPAIAYAAAGGEASPGAMHEEGEAGMASWHPGDG